MYTEWMNELIAWLKNKYGWAKQGEKIRSNAFFNTPWFH